MLNTAMMIAWRRTRDSTSTSVVLKLMESSSKRSKETGMTTQRKDLSA